MEPPGEDVDKLILESLFDVSAFEKGKINVLHPSSNFYHVSISEVDYQRTLMYILLQIRHFGGEDCDDLEIDTGSEDRISEGTADPIYTKC